VADGKTKPYQKSQENSMANTEPTRQFFQITNSIPEGAWYWAALGSILISAGLKLSGRDNWSIFVGQWPPTFLLFGLYHRLVRPSK
jgi:hypothetical protein